MSSLSKGGERCLRRWVWRGRKEKASQEGQVGLASACLTGLVSFLGGSRSGIWTTPTCAVDPSRPLHRHTNVSFNQPQPAMPLLSLLFSSRRVCDLPAFQCDRTRGSTLRRNVFTKWIRVPCHNEMKQELTYFRDQAGQSPATSKSRQAWVEAGAAYCGLLCEHRDWFRPTSCCDDSRHYCP